MEKMKTLYVNCPTKYRKQEDIDKTIEKLHKIAEITFGEKLSVINVPGEEKNDLKELADQLKLLSEADYYITLRIGGFHDIYRTAYNVDSHLYDYDIQGVEVDIEHVAPDMVEIRNKMHHMNRR